MGIFSRPVRRRSPFVKILHKILESAKIHHCLLFTTGLPVLLPVAPNTIVDYLVIELLIISIISDASICIHNYLFYVNMINSYF